MSLVAEPRLLARVELRSHNDELLPEPEQNDNSVAVNVSIVCLDLQVGLM